VVDAENFGFAQTHALPAWLQIAESEWDSIKASVLAICASSSRSSKPAIYGVAAEAEIRRLRPLSSMGQLEVRITLRCHHPMQHAKH
jgi:hypothetical protein